MARVAITVHDLAGSDEPANGIVTFTAEDLANDHEWEIKERDLLYAKNTDASAQVLTLVTTNDSDGRTFQSGGQSHAAGEARIYGPLKREGFAQSDGKCHVDLAAGTWELAVIRNIGN